MGKIKEKDIELIDIYGKCKKNIKIFTSYGPYLELDLCEKCIDDLYDFIGIEEKK